MQNIILSLSNPFYHQSLLRKSDPVFLIYNDYLKGHIIMSYEDFINLANELQSSHNIINVEEAIPSQSQKQINIPSSLNLIDFFPHPETKNLHQLTMQNSAQGHYERLFLRYEDNQILQSQLCKSLVYFLNPWLVKIQSNCVLEIYNIHFPKFSFQYELSNNEGK
jgi:hypothetical protein